jgi:hypothetical protein
VFVKLHDDEVLKQAAAQGAGGDILLARAFREVRGEAGVGECLNVKLDFRFRRGLEVI